MPRLYHNADPAKYITLGHVIRIYQLDRLLAEVELRDGKLRVRSYDGDWVAKSLESVRRLGQSDKELYESLPERLQGMVWAGYVK